MEDYKNILGLKTDDSPEIMADKFVIYIEENLSKFVNKLEEDEREYKDNDEEDGENTDDFKNFELKENEIMSFLSYFLDYLKTVLKKDNQFIDLFVKELIKISNIRFPKPEEDNNK